MNQPHLGAGDCRAVGYIIGETATFSKVADQRRDLDVTRNDAAAGDNAITRIASASSPHVLSRKAKPEASVQSSPRDQASHTMPTANDPTGPLDHSLGSSSDVSSSGEGLDQPSPLRMLTKRLPKIASKSGSSTVTPMPSSSQLSCPGQSSLNPSPVHSATASRDTGPALPAAGANESYDCIPEVSRELVTYRPTFSNNRR